MAGLSNNAVEYEPRDADPRLITGLAAGIFIFLIGSPLVLQLLFPDSLHRRVFVGDLTNVPAPRLQIDPQGDRAAFYAAEEKKLSSYGWTNGNRTAVHVPIDRAIALTLERGLAGWPKQ